MKLYTRTFKTIIYIFVSFQIIISFSIHNKLKHIRNFITKNDIVSSNKIKELNNLINNIHIQDINDQLINQWNNAMVPLTTTLIEDSNYSIKINILPTSYNLPLHSRPGTLFIKLLQGNSMINKYQMDPIELSNTNNNNNIHLHEEYNSNIHGFINNNNINTDDCICRGGICPRRYGCIFWIENKARESELYFQSNSNMIQSILLLSATTTIVEEVENVNKQSILVVDDHQDNHSVNDIVRSIIFQSPRDYPIEMNPILSNNNNVLYNTNTQTSLKSIIYIELFVPDEELQDKSVNIPLISYYHKTSSNSNNNKYSNDTLITCNSIINTYRLSTTAPVGFMSPMNIPWSYP